MARTRRQIILDVAADLAGSFLYYDRKCDEDLGVGEIEKAIDAGEITVDEIVEAFLASAGRNVRQFRRPQ